MQAFLFLPLSWYALKRENGLNWRSEASQGALRDASPGDEAGRNISDALRFEYSELLKAELLEQGKKTQGTRNDLLSTVDKKSQDEVPEPEPDEVDDEPTEPETKVTPQTATKKKGHSTRDKQAKAAGLSSRKVAEASYAEAQHPQ